MDETGAAVGDGLSRSDTQNRIAPKLRSRFAPRFREGSLEDYLLPSIAKAWDVIAMPVK